MLLVFITVIVTKKAHGFYMPFGHAPLTWDEFGISTEGQKCSHCGHVDKNSRDGEKFICTNCGHFDHADLQAARNIRNKGIERLGLPVACVFPAKYSKTVRVDCPEPEQLRLFETPYPESTGIKETKRQPSAKKRLPGNSLGEQLNLFDVDKIVDSN